MKDTMTVFERPGDTVTGFIADWELVPDRDSKCRVMWWYRIFMTNAYGTRTGGQEAVTLMLRESSTRRAIVDALREAMIDDRHTPSPGLRCRITYTGDTEPIGGATPVRQYRFEFAPRGGLTPLMSTNHMAEER